MTDGLFYAPGQKNCITDIAGILVGQAEDRTNNTGVTAVLAPDKAVAAVDVRGGAPGSRETELLRPDNLVDRVDGIVFSGGSAFGLAAADGVSKVVHARGGGFPSGRFRIPILPGAIIFDLPLLAEATETTGVDYPSLGKAAAEQASSDTVRLGNHGAGLGARAGGLKGGVGTASTVSEDGTLSVGALAIVNSVGSPVMPGSDAFWAWPFERNAEFGGRMPKGGVADKPLALGRELALAQNTTLVVVATSATLDKASAQRLAVMAQDGLARAIRPVHSPFDGDTVFVMATGEKDGLGQAELSALGTLAADTVARAIARGVYHADSLAGFRGYRDVFKV